MLEFTNLNAGTPAHRLPDLDVHEENGEIILRAEMPGLRLGEVVLRLENGELVLEADAWADGTGQEREHYEHVHGRLPLPFGGTTQVASQVADDVLEVHIPLPAVPEGEEWRPAEELAY